jgi:ketosteroid isomerase-like protein
MATNTDIIKGAYASFATGDVPAALAAMADDPVDRGRRISSGEPARVKMVHVRALGGGKAVAFQQHVDTIRVRELS